MSGDESMKKCYLPLTLRCPARLRFARMSLYHRPIPIRIVEKIQDVALEELQFHEKFEVSASSRVLSLRLHDDERGIIATELDAEDWQASAVEAFQLDLTTQFSNAAMPSDTRYDAIIAVDVIEHLEYPSLFFRNVKKLLKPRGLLILSIPSVTGLEYRLKIYKKCTLRYHWPMPHSWLLEEVLKPEANLESLFCTSSCIPNQPRWIAHLKGFLLRFFTGLKTEGIGLECYIIYFLRKK
jgi:SAM-dependent methyltransferase